MRRLAPLVTVSVAVVSTALGIAPDIARADDPVIQSNAVYTIIQDGSLKAGMDARQAINAPGADYTRVKAESDDPSAVQVDTPNVVAGSMGVSYTVKRNSGRPVVVTVTWLNPKTGDKQYRFFVLVLKGDDDPLAIHYDRVGAVTIFTHDGKAQATLPKDRVASDTENDRDFLTVPSGGAGPPDSDKDHPATVWFTHTGLALYQYDYTLGTTTHTGLFIINVADPAKAPAAAGPNGPAQPNKPAPVAPPRDDHGGGGD
ncbi:MAG TPA: hypothetical protein VGX97_05315 [bacterium]|nr:hypothetical protein [bacterium]